MKNTNIFINGVQSSIDSFIISTLLSILIPTMFAFGIEWGLFFSFIAIIIEVCMLLSSIKDALVNGILCIVGLGVGMCMVGQIGQFIVLALVIVAIKSAHSYKS